MKSRFIIFIVSSAVILAIAIFGTMEYTSRPQYCNSCHEMNSMYSAWSTSAHKKVLCLKCHAKPGTIGYFEAKLGGLKDVYYHITGTYKKPIKVIGDSKQFNVSCLQCHKNKVGQNTPHNTIHFKVGLACTECHDDLVHNKKNNTKPPTLAICNKCHE